MKLTLHVADDIRVEATGKCTALGLYPDAVLVVDTSNRPADLPDTARPSMDRLSVMATISDLPEGTYRFGGRFFRPSGQPTTDELDFGEAQIRAGRSHSIVVELRPFVVHEFGEYTFRATVGNQQLEGTFWVQELVRAGGDDLAGSP